MACKHVRNTVVHSHLTKCADRNEDQKEAFKNRYPFSGIIWDKQNDTIDLTNACIANDFFEFLEKFADRLVHLFDNFNIGSTVHESTDV